MDHVIEFNAELKSLLETRPPVSKSRMTTLTKMAIKAVKLYKHVVQSVEKFIAKSSADFKIPGLYVMDSIIRQSRHLFGQEKDVFAARFAKNMTTTFKYLVKCKEEEKSKILKVLHLWSKSAVFDATLINSLRAFVQETMVDKPPPPPSSHNEPLDQKFDNFQHQFDSVINTQQPQNPDNMRLDNSINQHMHLDINQQTYNPHDDVDVPDDDDNNNPPQPVPPPKPLVNNYTSILSGLDLTNLIPNLAAILQNAPKQPTNSPQLPNNLQLPDFNPQALNSAQSANTIQQQQMTSNIPLSHTQQQSNNNNNDDDEMDLTNDDITHSNDVSWSENVEDWNNQKHHNQHYQQKHSQHKPQHYPPDNQQQDEVINLMDEEEDDEQRWKHRHGKNRQGYMRHDYNHKRHKNHHESPDVPRDHDCRAESHEHVLVWSRTLWIGRLSKQTSEGDLVKRLQPFTPLQSIDLITSRGCAFVVFKERGSADAALQDLTQHPKLFNNTIKVAWAVNAGLKEGGMKEYWDGDDGVVRIPWKVLREKGVWNDEMQDGGSLVLQSLPPEYRDEPPKPPTIPQNQSPAHPPPSLPISPSFRAIPPPLHPITSQPNTHSNVLPLSKPPPPIPPYHPPNIPPYFSPSWKDTRPPPIHAPNLPPPTPPRPPLLQPRNVMPIRGANFNSSFPPPPPPNHPPSNYPQFFSPPNQPPPFNTPRPPLLNTPINDREYGQEWRGGDDGGRRWKDNDGGGGGNERWNENDGEKDRWRDAGGERSRGRNDDDGEKNRFRDNEGRRDRWRNENNDNNNSGDSSKNWWENNDNNNDGDDGNRTRWRNNESDESGRNRWRNNNDDNNDRWRDDGRRRWKDGGRDRWRGGGGRDRQNDRRTNDDRRRRDGDNRRNRGYDRGNERGRDDVRRNRDMDGKEEKKGGEVKPEVGEYFSKEGININKILDMAQSETSDERGVKGVKRMRFDEGGKEGDAKSYGAERKDDGGKDKDKKDEGRRKVKKSRWAPDPDEQSEEHVSGNNNNNENSNNIVIEKRNIESNNDNITNTNNNTMSDIKEYVGEAQPHIDFKQDSSADTTSAPPYKLAAPLNDSVSSTT